MENKLQISISLSGHSCLSLRKERETERGILTSWCSHGTVWYQTAGCTKAVGETDESSRVEFHTHKHSGHIKAAQLWENFSFSNVPFFSQAQKHKEDCPLQHHI